MGTIIATCICLVIIRYFHRYFIVSIKRRPLAVKICLRNNDLKVLSIFTVPGIELGALGISNATCIPLGVLHPILSRLEKAELLESHWVAGSYPRRRLYRVTPEGVISAREMRAATVLKWPKNA